MYLKYMGRAKKENELRRHVHDIGLDGKVLFKGFRKDIYDCIYDATIALSFPRILKDCRIR